jgi:prolyl-tRNA editing enzyme YbaK/EbsC (Cys-tRNA(Pro) deacylase)
MNPIQILQTKAVPHEVITLSAPVHSALEVQQACNCSLQQVLKTMVFVSGENTVLAVVPGDRRVSQTLLKAVLETDDDLRMAKGDEIHQRTGQEIGSVSPFSSKGVKVVFEKEIFELSAVFIGSGDKSLLIQISPDDLLFHTQGIMGVIAK